MAMRRAFAQTHHMAGYIFVHHDAGDKGLWT